MKNKDKQTKSQGNLLKKEGRNIKEIVPPNVSNIRNNLSIKIPKNIANLPQRVFNSILEPIKLFAEWPKNEEEKNFNFFKDLDEIYSDPDIDKIFLPMSMLMEASHQVKWIRLYDIYLENILLKEILIKYPFKNINKIKKFLIQSYCQNSCPIKFKTFENSDEFNMIDIENPNLYCSGNKKLFRHFFKFFEATNLKVVNFYERKETPEEIKLRIDQEEKALFDEWKIKQEKEEQALFNSNKKMKQKASVEVKPPIFNLNRDPKIKREMIINNISMNETYCDFSKWIGSILQNIKDLDITDVNDPTENIWKKIYPQKDGIPVFNPKGIYWVKLYHMGKQRKIVIDDRIPCNKNGESLLPHCENVDEIWPAIITKALLKMFSYKFKSLIYSKREIGDIHILYALTGYIPEKISFSILEKNFINDEFDEKFKDKTNLIKVQEYVKRQLSYYLSDESFFYKKYFVMAYNHTDETELLDLGKQLFNKSPKNKLKIGVPKKILKLESSNNGKIGMTKSTKFNKIEEEIDDHSPKPMIIKDNSYPVLNLVAMEKIKKNSSMNVENIKNSNFVNKLVNSANYQYNEMLTVFHSNSKDKNDQESKRPNFLANYLKMSKQKDFMQDNDQKRKMYYGIPKTQTNISNDNNSNQDNMNPIIQSNNLIFEKNLQNISTDSKRISSNKEVPDPNQSNKLHDIGRELTNKETIADIKLSRTNLIKNFFNFSTDLQKNNNKRSTILNLFKVETSGSLFYKKPSIISNNQTETNLQTMIKECNNKENEKLESKVLIDCLYPLIDIFDNINFNMKRLKPLDVDDLKKKIMNKKICYKQLSREEKKNYINSIMELKSKQKELKHKKIEELHSEGKRVFSIKILNSFVGGQEFHFYFPFSEDEIYVTKKCLLNKWKFPPYSYLEKLHPALNINEVNKKNSFNSPYSIYENDSSTNLILLNSSPTKMRGAKEINSNVLDKKENNTFQTPHEERKIDRNISENKSSSKNNLIKMYALSRRNSLRKQNIPENINTSQNMSFDQGDKVAFNSNTSQIISVKNSKNTSIWPFDFYMELINNNTKQYEKQKNPLLRISEEENKNSWINLDDFLNNFNNVVVLHNVKNFRVQKEIDFNWYNSNQDFYNSNEDSKVIFISTKNTNDQKDYFYSKFYDNLVDKNDFFIYEEDSSKPKKINLMVEYTCNFDYSGYFKEFNFYVNLDIYKISDKSICLNNKQSEKFELVPIQENCVIKGFYSTVKIDNLMENEEYLCFIKGGLNPLGYHLNFFLEKGFIDSMCYSKYLIKHEKFSNLMKNFKFEIPNCFPNCNYLLLKLKALITTNNIRIKFDFNIKDVYLSQFFDFFIVRINENKLQDFKKILFSEIINLHFENEERKSKGDIHIHEIYFILILNSAFYVNETSMELDILTNDPVNINIENIENIPPYEVKDSLILSKDNYVFKEYIYAADVVHATLFIEVKKSKSKSHINNINLKNDSQINSIHNGSGILSESLEEENKTMMMSSYFDLPTEGSRDRKDSERLRLKLEISYQNQSIYKSEFFESIFIPNFIFEGIAIPSQTEILSSNKKKEKKEEINVKELEKTTNIENIPYSITCSLDISEAPSWIKIEEIEWNIRVFSSDTLAFVKDTSKEQFEKSLKDSWEIHEPGRSLKAKTSRYKFVLENKHNNNEIFNREEVKFLEYFKKAEGNIDRIPILQYEEMNFANPLMNTTKDKSEFDKGILDKSKIKKVDADKGGLDKSKVKKGNLNNSEKKPNAIKENINNLYINTNESIKLNLNNINNREEKINKGLKFGFNDIIITPNDYIENLNFFKTYSTKKLGCETANNFFKSINPQANYIKNFMEYVEEDRTKIIKNNAIAENEIYKQTKGYFFTDKKLLDNKFSKSTGNFHLLEKNKMKLAFDINILKEKQDKHIKTFYQKSNFLIKNIKNEKNKLMKIREEFRTTFNSCKDTEARILDMLENDREGSNMDQIIYMYRQIVVSEHKSATITKIHNLISKKKEELINDIISKPATNDNIRRIIEDIKLNKWNISPGLLKKINDLSNED